MKKILARLRQTLPPSLAVRLRDMRDRHQIGAARRQMRMLNGEQRNADMVEKALAAAAQGTADGRSRDWFDRIERRRLDLLRSDAFITQIDYGKQAKQGPVTRQRPLRRATEDSRSRPWGEFLFNLVRAVGPEQVVEMGACVGVSASYIAAALEMNGKGRLVTLEGDPTLAGIVEETLASLGLGHRVRVVCGPFEQTLKPTLEELGKVDLLFHDGIHEGWAYLQDFATMRPHLAPGAVVVYDDIRWGSSDLETIEAWQKIGTDSAVRAAIDCGPVGVLVAA